MSNLIEFPADIAQHADPYGFMSDLREQAPVVPVLWRGTLQTWLVTRYDDCCEALANPVLSHETRFVQTELSAHFGNDVAPFLKLESNDPPEHTRLRRAVSKFFAARCTEGLAPAVERIVTDRIDSIDEDEVDLIGILEKPPLFVLGDLFGVPVEDRGELYELTASFFQPFDDPESGHAAADAARRMTDYLSELADRYQREPDDNLFSAMVNDTDVMARLSLGELAEICTELITAGIHGAISMIGNGVLALLRNPDQMAVLRRRPELLPPAIDELIRYDGSLLEKYKFTKEAVDIAGTRIPAGRVILLCLGSANRDPRKFDHPDRLDVERGEVSHLGFGYGIHHCLGYRMGKLIGEVVFRTLLDRYSEITLQESSQQLRHSRTTLRRLAELPVRLQRR
ncbi:cytochrome P450 [Streptomyces sp. NPDC002676]